MMTICLFPLCDFAIQELDLILACICKSDPQGCPAASTIVGSKPFHQPRNGTKPPPAHIRQLPEQPSPTPVAHSNITNLTVAPLGVVTLDYEVTCIVNMYHT